MQQGEYERAAALFEACLALRHMLSILSAGRPGG